MKPRLFNSDAVHGKKVLVRVDFNVPIENGLVRDDTRIRESLPTIVALLSAGAYPTLISHLGRPKGKIEPAFSLSPVAKALRKLLAGAFKELSEVIFVPSCIGDEVRDAVANQKPNSVILLENVRFYEGEEKNDEAFARELAKPFDVFINDAFGSLHRAHASTEGVTRFLPSFAGLLVEKEVSALSRLIANFEHPFVVVIGGKKVSDKLPLLKRFIGCADIVLIGGAIASTFAKASGASVGKSLVEDELLLKAREIMDEYRRSTSTFVLPSDFSVTDDVNEVGFLANRRLTEVGRNEFIADIGSSTRDLYVHYLRNAQTIFFNGAMGVFEIAPFDAGSRAVAQAIATNEKAFKVAGGGETLELINKFGLKHSFSHLSTGGGASLEFIATGTLPGLVPLLEQ